MSLTRKAPTAAKGDGKPKRQDLVQALVERDAELAEARRENARLLDELQAKTRDLEESLQQQTATADVLKAISRTAFDLDTVLETLVSTAARLCDAKHGQIFRRHGDVYRYAASQMEVDPAYLQHEQAAEIRPGRGTLVGRVALENRTVEIADAWNDPEYAEKAEARLGGVRAMLGVPLIRGGEPIGAFALARSEPIPFTPRQVELVTTFADQAVIAIENVRLFDEVQAKTRDLEESLQQQTATANVLKVISRSAFDLGAVLKTLTESAHTLSGAATATVFLHDGEVLRLRAESGVAPEFLEYLVANPIPPGRETVTGRVLMTGEAVLVPDVLADPDYNYGAGPRLGNYRALLGVPLIRDGKVEGVFGLQGREPGAFTQRQIELVRTFADQAVIAIGNVRLFDEVQAKTRDLEESLTQQTATADVLKVISRSAFDLPAVLRTLVESAAKLCDADKATITRQIDGVFYRAESYGFSEEFMDAVRNIPVAPERGSITGRVMLEGKAVHVEDVEADPEYWPKNFTKPGELRTGLGIPMMRDGAPIGVLALMRTEVRPFNAKQIELVQTFADQAVIAIENARLFDEVQARTRDLEESLRQQTATADVLKVISRSAFDLDVVFDALLASAVSLVGSRGGTICVREGDGFRYRAVAEGRDSAMWRYLSEHPPTPGRASVAGRILLSGRPEIITDSLLDGDLEVPVHALAGSRSVAGVPLLRDDKVEGALMVGRAEAGPFDSRQIELLQTFADQAVIAIENVRLFDEVQARTRDLSEALQQQTATAEVLKVISRSAFDLQAVLTTLAESARELCGASFVTLFMRDGDEMRLRAESGCTPEIVAFLRAHPIRAGRETFTGRVMLSGEAVHLPDVLADPEYDFGEAPRIGNYRALLGVPLLRDGQVEGVFTLARPEPAPFTARQIEMVRAFADQAVIAIENARLFDEVQARTRELAASLDDLRKAQDRLIQSEKLASLGQLTAGIAHEIKNPLNFINNFSALSRELIGELAEAIKGGAANEAARGETDELIGAIVGNLDKIVHHGKRADSIVKNMLLHSREGSGERSTTNINAMVEEALNLAYHGARAEKPGFNVTIVKSLDPNAGAADVYAQEMTRVLLNLISNGFYATSKRKQSLGDGAYEPTISASTRDLGSKVEIAIRDNGTGIPDEVKAKMFNPFFTTKPAGEGTGLGLSLSHDIVVKQHGGLIEVLTEPDAFTQFTIVLPRGVAQL
jgi:GAF domain-containing protein